MPRESIVGSGRRGFGFEQKGFQERNLALLLDTLSQKETQKSIEALSKIDKDEWKAMALTTQTLREFITLGGTSALVTSLTTSIKETFTLQIESLLSPLTNTINQAITDAMTPFIDDVITPIINNINQTITDNIVPLLQPIIDDLANFLSENATGAGVGGIIGGVLLGFLPGGRIVGAIVGALLGALVEGGYALIGDLLAQGPADAPYAPNMTALYELETGNTFTSIFDWQYISWFNSRSGAPTGSLGSSRPQERIGGPQVDF